MQVNFARNFGGRAPAMQFHSVTVYTSTGKPVCTVVEPAEFRIREDGTVTIYSRKFPGTSVYGIDMRHRIIIGMSRNDGADVQSLTF